MAFLWIKTTYPEQLLTCHQGVMYLVRCPALLCHTLKYIVTDKNNSSTIWFVLFVIPFTIPTPLGALPSPPNGPSVGWSWKNNNYAIRHADHQTTPLYPVNLFGSLEWSLTNLSHLSPPPSWRRSIRRGVTWQLAMSSLSITINNRNHKDNHNQ